MNIITPKSFLIKHKILEFFSNNLIESTIDHSSESMIELRDIKKSFPELTEKKVVEYLNSLIASGEIKNLDIKGHNIFSSTNIGISSFIDEKYLKLGRKETLDKYYDYGKNATVWFAAIGLFLSLWKECNTKTNTLQLESKLSRLELKIDTLYNQTNIHYQNHTIPTTDNYLKKDQTLSTQTTTVTTKEMSKIQNKKE